MNIYQFFNVLSYNRDKKAEEQRQIEKYKRQQGVYPNGVY